MKKTLFKGAATALITPLDENGVNYAQLGKLIDWQIGEGINALVIAGTTGEGSTLTDDEHKAVLKYSVEKAGGRVPIIAGTGSNDTAYAVELTKYACSVGCDGMLVVTPYYNKATQNGLIRMYETIADASDKPLILYNVPSRTGVGIEPKTYLALSEHPNIVGIKEANGNISKIAETFALVGNRLAIYSGNDDQIVPIMSLGGMGVISVLSNVAPAETAKMCRLMLDGSTYEAAKMQLDYLPLINALFSEVNPIPVKYAMSEMGFCKNFLRLPLTEMEEAHAAVLRGLMKEKGLVK
ncbi:MAG: 4-hydroxy-tetrahydrodipicolinate synthase [Firmicutes bacterium]|nr:4-hydroxy-tetrahydrodipicolinate synthase [Candidatus Colimorpha enterica]